VDWNQAAESMMKAWARLLEQEPGGDDATAQQIARQVITGQTAMLRFAELAITAWTDVATRIEQGQDWQDALQIYTRQMREQFAGAYAGVAQSAQDLSDLWLVYLDEWRQLVLPWTPPIRPIPNGFAGRSGPELLELSNLYWETFECLFGSLMQSPGLGMYSRPHSFFPCISISNNRQR